jgi:4-hydroxybenzoate polyprenyltransferase
MLKDKLSGYWQLMRADKPIGIYLLLWPTVWALWLAAEGVPDWPVLLIFVAGVVLMRSAGCVINDYADRHFDGAVQRTAKRPLVTGMVTEKEALVLFMLLIFMSFILVILLNWQTVLLSFGALILAASYPFMKRYTHLPQVVLGAAFSWSIPMAFMAITEQVPWWAWLLYLANVLWTVAYDTQYAMVDREDDVKIGVKSTAILFGRYDRLMIGLLQLTMLVLLFFIGRHFHLSWPFMLALLVSLTIFLYQNWLIRSRARQASFTAFLNNHYVGLVIALGIIGHYCLVSFAA